MAKQVFSEELKCQTQLAWDYIEKAKPLINYMKLVPMDEQQISEFEGLLDINYPDDFRYWLSNFGSGRIEFLEGSLRIVSPYELQETFHLYGYLGERSGVYVSSWDSGSVDIEPGAVDTDGLTPVVLSKEDKEVIASSWPMYLIKCIVEVSELLSECDLSPEQRGSLDLLKQENFLEIDANLSAALQRVADFDRKEADGCGESKNSQAATAISMMNFFMDMEEAHQKRRLIPRLRTFVKDLLRGNDELSKALAQIEDQINKGYSSLTGSDLFFRDKVSSDHKARLEKLHKHERREVRELAEKGLCRLNPALAEKQADRAYDWLKCAENWLHVRKQKDEAIRCLRMSESMGVDRDDWDRCADFWNEELSMKDEACRCLKNAEAVSKSVDDYYYIADSWYKTGEMENAKRCLIQCEGLIEVDNDISALAWAAAMWFEKFSDIDAATRCLTKAEPLIDHPGYWGDCARAWEKIGNEEEAQRCQKKELEMREEMFGSE